MTFGQHTLQNSGGDNSYVVQYDMLKSRWGWIEWSGGEDFLVGSNTDPRAMVIDDLGNIFILALQHNSQTNVYYGDVVLPPNSHQEGLHIAKLNLGIPDVDGDGIEKTSLIPARQEKIIGHPILQRIMT